MNINDNSLPLIYISRIATRDFLVIGELHKIPLDSIIQLGIEHDKLEIWCQHTTITIHDEEMIEAIGKFFANHCICHDGNDDDNDEFDADHCNFD